MIPTECKRLAEVDFPIAEVSRHSAREKSIRHGHPSTLHLWWARRPLAACRAMLLALLLPDPCDEHCPDAFKKNAREILGEVRQPPKSDEELRKALLWFIGSFSNWDMAAQAVYLRVSRELVRAAYSEEAPLVVDPFAGGGSIPLEALRLGCEAFASDLNPVACLILKVMLEDIPRYGPKLGDEVRRVGAEIKAQAEKELADLYPKDADGAIPIAYLWARTVRCETPRCGAEIPLMRSFWLCNKARRKWALRYKVVRRADQQPRVELELFEPRSDKEVPGGTVSRAKATCLCCNTVLPPERVRAQLTEQRGGADAIFDEQGQRAGGARMTAVVTLRPGESGRCYRAPTDADYAAARKAQERLAGILDDWERRGKEGICPVPDEPTPPGGGSGAGRAFSLQRYGMMKFRDLYSARQSVALATLCSLVDQCQTDPQVRSASRNAMALVASRCADYNSAYARWAPSGEFVGNTFGRQALGPSWEFCETFLLSSESGGYPGALQWVVRVLAAHDRAIQTSGQVAKRDARDSPLPDESSSVWFTDPPYYDAVPYSDLSDYFYVWQKRELQSSETDAWSQLTPKTEELIQDEIKKWNGGVKDQEFFEAGMSAAFAEGRRVLGEGGIGCVVFAHKTTEGWEALLGGMIKARWTLSASWPIASERPGRLRSQDSAALATSVHLVCRPRPEDAPVGDWADVLRELPGRVVEWMDRLQSEGIRGADLVFACIGPALEIFSRYRSVETAEGREVGLPEYLEKVWEVVGRTALEEVLGTNGSGDGAATVLEEDARLTALFLWTLQTTTVQNGNGDAVAESDDEEEETGSGGKAKGFSLVYDVVRRFAQPLGIQLPTWEGRIVETKKGVVRLLAVSERAKALFGDEGASAVAEWIEREPGGDVQAVLFPELEERAPRTRGRGRRKALLERDAALQSPDATTLDRVHAAMLLQAGGRANALRTLIQNEQERGPDFLRLANALSALYPKSSEEKRLLDAMLLAVPR